MLALDDQMAKRKERQQHPAHLKTCIATKDERDRLSRCLFLSLPSIPKLPDGPIEFSPFLCSQW